MLSARPEINPAASGIPVIGDVVSGKYCVDGTAGIGGMGVVLSATHVELGHRVAIKVLATEDATDNTAIERFLREGKVVASLRSDHVVRIYDVGRLETGMPFMVMELLEGQDLGSLVGARIVDTSQAVDWILQACSAIAEAHSNGIIHRDLKPANLFLTQRSDGSDCIKVLDFGISKRMVSADSEALQGNLTATRQVIGSPAYMSPEQVRNSRDIDHRVDIWALGMTLYEFLAGRTAFDADTFPAVCAAIVADSPPPLRQVAPNVPRELENIVLKCLDKDPSRRFASVNDLILALQPFGSPRIASAVRSNQLNSGAQGSQQGTDQASTLASGRIPDGAQGSSAPAQVKSHQELMAQTLQSSGENAAAGLWPLNAAQRRNVWLLLALFGFGGGAIWKYYSAHSIHIRPKNPPIAAVPMNRASFTVRFESEPSGAQIWEGERLLGTTPLSLPIERTSVTQHPREFLARAEGYAPFAISQHDSEQDVSVVAHLSPGPSVLERKSRTAVPIAKTAAQTPQAVGKAINKAKPAAARGTTPVPDDIRTQR